MPKLKKIALDQMRPPEPVIESLLLEHILDFPLNPRTWFDTDKIAQLAESIEANDLIAPIIVREHPKKPKYFQVIVGARRVKASRLKEIKYIRAEIRELTDREALVLAKEENSNREDTNPIEDTISTLNLISLDTNLTHEEIKSLLYQMAKGRNVPTDFSEVVEKVFQDLKTISLSTFTKDRLRLLNLPLEVYRAVVEGSIEHTKAVVIARIKDESERQKLLDRAIAEKISISEIKAKIKELQGKPPIDYSELKSAELKERIKSSYSKLSRNKNIWSDPAKRKKIESLLSNLDSLLAS